MFHKLDAVVKRYEQLTERLADPTIYDRQAEFREVSGERAKLEEIVVEVAKALFSTVESYAHQEKM